MCRNLDKASILKKIKDDLDKNRSIVLNGIIGHERTIKMIKDDKIFYKTHNGNRELSYSIDLFIQTYQRFVRTKVTTVDLRNYNEHYGKTKPCNAVVFFLLSNYLFDIEIFGNGKAHNPFGAYLK